MHYGDYKTILSAKNGMNLYRGCTHGCIYCDSRSNCYQMDHDFEDVEVKRNAPQILEAQLRRKRKLCMIGTGSMSDPYLPLERQLQLTRQCLELIKRHGFGISLITKSNLVLRDLDLLTAINARTKCVVQMTLTTFNEELCEIVEPNVSTTLERFHALEIMQAAGIPTVVWLSPILPFINDSEENLKGILDYCIKAKVKGIICFGFGMTLREGNREYYYAKLDEHFEGMKERYMSRYGNAYSCLSPNNSRLMRIFKSTCQEHDIMSDPKAVFAYLSEYKPRQTQLSLFS